jgi:phage terminase large subunit-like protein
MTQTAVGTAAASNRAELLALLEERERRNKRRQFYRLFPDTDILDAEGNVAVHARHKYPKHLEFFAAGTRYRERAAICANRVGKTYGMGGYEVVCHLTGQYPDWWPGRRFNRPIHAWAAGDWNETTRDIIQATLCGKIAYQGTRRIVDGTGLIPGDLIGDLTWKQGVANMLDTMAVKHVSGDWSWLGFKSYQQGRASFQGTAKDVIWLDEEPPPEVYSECLTRTATTGGMMILTFTPLRGYSDVVRSFRPEDQIA